jgi:SAM-dependent methyltransferase
MFSPTPCGISVCKRPNTWPTGSRPDFAGARDALAIDVACGPGTFTRPLAARVRRAIGVDLTPAMIEKARAETARTPLINIEFVCADVDSLPFEDGVAGIVCCGYAIHHMDHPARALSELARVLRPGGRMVITDIIVPTGSDAEHRNAIERVRDPSHTNQLTVEQFRALFENGGLRVLSEELNERWYDFDVWMRNAGRAPGDASYVEVRRMTEESMAHDTTGLRPRLAEKSGSLELVRTTLLIVAEKPE